MTCDSSLLFEEKPKKNANFMSVQSVSLSVLTTIGATLNSDWAQQRQDQR